MEMDHLGVAHLGPHLCDVRDQYSQGSVCSDGNRNKYGPRKSCKPQHGEDQNAINFTMFLFPAVSIF